MKIRELLSDPSKWTQGCFARDVYGGVASRLEDECRWCLVGALGRCYDDSEFDRVYDLIKAAVPERQIVHWNDDPKRTFEDVRKLVEELNI